MKYFNIIFVILTLLFCGFCGNKNNDVESNGPGFELKKLNGAEKLYIYSAGIGYSREQAKLSAQTFLAEQINGVFFKLNKNKLVLKTPETLISGGIPLYYRKLNSNQILCVMRSQTQINKNQDKTNFIEIHKEFILKKFLDNREDFYFSLFSKELVDRIKKLNISHGRILLNKIIVNQSNLTLNDKIKIKFKIIL